MSYPQRCRCRRCRGQFQVKVFSSPGTNVLGELMPYPRHRCCRCRRRRCRRRRQFQVKVSVY